MPTYGEGDWFAVPLREGGFAAGVVARANPKAVLLGYFFGPRRAAVPSVEEVSRLRPDDAVLVGKFGPKQPGSRSGVERILEAHHVRLYAATEVDRLVRRVRAFCCGRYQP